MYVSIESGACVGCGSCEAICPEVFTLNSHDIAQAIEDIAEENFSKVRKAARMCPVNCIFIDED